MKMNQTISMQGGALRTSKGLRCLVALFVGAFALVTTAACGGEEETEESSSSESEIKTAKTQKEKDADEECARIKDECTPGLGWFSCPRGTVCTWACPGKGQCITKCGDDQECS